MPDLFPSFPVYTPEDWYWVVGADTDRVWSSARAAYVDFDDGAYLAWLDEGRRLPTSILSEDELFDVLKVQAPAGLPNPPVIIPYSAFRTRWSDDELAALFTAKSAHWQVEDLVVTATAQNSVNLASAAAATAKALFVSLGVLTSERADVVFAAE